MEGDPALTVEAQAPTRNATRLALIMAAIAALVIAMAATISPALAGGIVGPDVEPTFVDGNPTCGSLGFINESKVEPVTGGLHDFGDFEVTLTLHDTADGPTFDFTSNIAVDAVFVKGGSNGNLYDYSGSPVTTDDGLHAPVNPANDLYYGLSHISFCWTPAQESESQPGESESPEGSVGGGTGTPDPSVPDTSMSLPGVGGPLATLIFGAILVASLGTLAYANVRAAKQRQ